MGLIKKEGCLIKSPPEGKTKNKGSWHKRYFVLLEIGFNDKLKTRDIKEHNPDVNNNNNNNNNMIEDPKRTEEFANFYNNSSTEIYLMYWKDLLAKKERKSPKGKVDFKITNTVNSPISGHHR